ncbi:metalloregulator ArsR/SmtB family transcription factor [Methanosphaera cuniculi]|uniref:ArsR/SmtB family transcription factor n=1 Tax=Methanosphaera cuniculi TaxID=1077256 RepID=UPI0026F30E3A|nr:metalloregulator ArsR/SmtB family transcription factor [Methanosphaera cuniculi]
MKNVEKNQEEDMCSIKEIHTDSIKKAKKQLEDEETYQLLAETFKIFGNTTRLKIMSLLSVEDLCVCDLCEAMDMSQSAISHQLRTLRAQNLVKYKKEGKQARYSLADKHVVEILKIGIEHVLE